MKIGIDAREFKVKSLTGIARYLGEFLKYGLKYNCEHEYILFCNQSTHIPFQEHRLKKVFIPEYFTFWWDQVQLPRYLKKERIDIFLTPYFKAPFFLRCKLIVIINDLIPVLFPAYQNPKNILKRVYFKNLVNIATKRADRIITISDHSKKDIIKLFHVPEEKIKVITLVVGEAFRCIDFGLEEVVSKYKIDGKFIFYFGNFYPHKNVKVLIEAYQKLPLRLKEEYKLVIGGKRDRYHYTLFKLVQRLGLQDKVIFTGFVSEEDLSYLYSAAEVFVFPSLYEGFGLPPLEAMACGTPVITSNTTSLPEVVGEAAILVNPYKVDDIKAAIVRVLTDSALRNDLIRKGLERSGQFTSKKMADQILKVFAEVQGAK